MKIDTAIWIFQKNSHCRWSGFSLNWLLFSSSLWNRNPSEYVKKSLMHRSLTKLGDFLLFSINAVQRLFPETYHDSYKADAYWRPVTWSVPVVLSLIIMFTSTAHFFPLGFWWGEQHFLKDLRRFLILAVKVFTWNGEHMTSVSEERSNSSVPAVQLAHMVSNVSCLLPASVLSAVRPVDQVTKHEEKCLIPEYILRENSSTM